MKPSPFRLLLIWVDGHRTWTDEDAMQEITEAEAEALEGAAAAHADGFLLLGQRNWELEVRTRRVHLPSCVRPLFTMPDGEAVDRLLGWEDKAGKWHAGLADVQPREAQVLRRRIVDRRATWEICQELHVRPGTVRHHLSEGRKKVRQALGLPALQERKPVRGNVRADRTPVPERLALTSRAASGGRR